jgi:hypothetical protein
MEVGVNEEFTLKDITDAMLGGVFITHKGFDPKEYIYFKNGNWKTEKGDPAGYVTFHDLENWSYWHYPKKMVKRTFYRAYVYEPVSDAIVPYPVMFSTKDEAIKDAKVKNIVDWDSKEFEIPAK